jgi:hypothetical protein
MASVGSLFSAPKVPAVQQVAVPVPMQDVSPAVTPTPTAVVPMPSMGDANARSAAARRRAALQGARGRSSTNLTGSDAPSAQTYSNTLLGD